MPFLTGHVDFQKGKQLQWLQQNKGSKVTAMPSLNLLQESEEPKVNELQGDADFNMNSSEEEKIFSDYQ